MLVTKTSGGFTCKAYIGDAKTLLAFTIDKAAITDLAGFTIYCTPPGTGQPPYYIYNKIQFKDPTEHAQNKNEPAYSTINAPIQKFRWLHVPGSFHQGQQVSYGLYNYDITPRYFDKGILQSLDPKKTLSIKVNVSPFSKNNIDLGFTRGFVQSQAFEQHFGKTLVLQPASRPLLFSTATKAGKNADGQDFTYLDEYEWSGFTAREKIFSVLNEVIGNKNLSLDLFAYDLNEPDLVAGFLKLAGEKRIRVILDNATLHLDKKNKKTGKMVPSPENLFTTAFQKKDKADILRGKFGRFAHDKVFIVRDKKSVAQKVLTGSTNFSVTGMYVNSNHVLIFSDPKIAALYATVFDEAWKDLAKAGPFSKSSVATQSFYFPSQAKPLVEFAFSPHSTAFATSYLNGIAARIKKEKSSILFAVMDIGPKNSGPIFPALRDLHKNGKVFSYGISDNPGGITLYKPSAKTGVLVTGKPARVILPPPFNQEVSIGLGHQVHHKFVVCGFNTDDAVVYCGSSNLALMGEKVNGDNLIAIRDVDIATVFALEALALVDHFHFRNVNQISKTVGKKKVIKPKPFYLNETNKWAVPYYDTRDLHCADRLLFQ